MIEQPSRRGFLAGLGALFIAAPAIVRATSIMPVKLVDFGPSAEFLENIRFTFGPDVGVMSELQDITREAFRGWMKQHLLEHQRFVEWSQTRP